MSKCLTFWPRNLVVEKKEGLLMMTMKIMRGRQRISTQFFRTYSKPLKMTLKLKMTSAWMKNLQSFKKRRERRGKALRKSPGGQSAAVNWLRLKLRRTPNAETGDYGSPRKARRSLARKRPRKRLLLILPPISPPQPLHEDFEVYHILDSRRDNLSLKFK
jgi:hypothetical protein